MGSIHNHQWSVEYKRPIKSRSSHCSTALQFRMWKQSYALKEALSAGARAMQPFFAEVLPGGPMAVKALKPQPAASPAQASAMSPQELLGIIAGTSTLCSTYISRGLNWM